MARIRIEPAISQPTPWGFSVSFQAAFFQLFLLNGFMGKIAFNVGYYLVERSAHRYTVHPYDSTRTVWVERSACSYTSRNSKN